MKRALTSASNIYQRELCPGSAAAEFDFPEPEDAEGSESSKEGTLLHALDADPSLDRSQITGEQADVLTLAAEVDKSIFGAVHSALELPEDEPYEEKWEVALALRKGIKMIFPGHADRVRYYPSTKTLVIIDKKFGRRVVTEASANLQLRAYAVMGAAKWDVQNIMVAINQPRLPYEERLSVAEYTREVVAAAKEQLLAIYYGAHNEDGSPRRDVPRVAGEEQCRYCSARLHCDAYRAKYEWLADPSGQGRDAYIAKLQELTDDQLDRVNRAITFAKLIEDPTKDEIIKRSQAGGMKMYELGKGRAIPSITDRPRAVALLKSAGFLEEEIYQSADLGLTVLSEKYRLRTGSTIKEAKQAVKQALEPVLLITESRPIISRIKGYKAEQSALPPSQKSIASNDEELFPK